MKLSSSNNGIKLALLGCLVSFLASTVGRGDATWANNSTDWATNLGSSDGTAYTIGSGATPASSQGVYFRYFNNSGAANLAQTYNIQDLYFQQTPYSGTTGYTITDTNNSALVFTGGTAATRSNYGVLMSYFFQGTGVNEAINTPIYIEGNQVQFANDTISSQNDTLSFGTTASPQNISGLQLSSGADPTTLLLFGVGNGTINDNIIDGSSQGSLTNTAVVSLEMISSATWTLTGTDAYSGTTTVMDGGTLVLDDTTHNAPKLSSSSALNLGGSYYTNGNNTYQYYAGGGTVKLLGNSSNASTQTVNGVNLNAGASNLQVNAGANGNATLNLGTITVASGGTLNFTLVNGSGTGVAAIITSTPTANGILGGWATYGGTDWATVNGSNDIVAATYTSTFGLNNNVKVTGSESANNNSNSLIFTGLTAPTTLTLKSGTNEIQSGGILDASTNGANSVTITGGDSLTSGYDPALGSNDELLINQYDTSGTLYIQSKINSPVVTIAGGGTVNLSGNNSALTTVNVDSGTLQVGSSTALNSNTTVNLVNPSAVLDLDGNSVGIGEVYSYNIIGGTTAQNTNLGLVPVVENSVAGSISTLTIAGSSTFPSTGYGFDGNLSEGAGAILNVIVTGDATIDGGWNGSSFASTWNSGGNLASSGNDGSLPEGVYDFINGGLTVGSSGSSSGQVDIASDLYMLGALTLYGKLADYQANGGGYNQVSTTYLEGTGLYGGAPRDGLWVNLGGSSVQDVFNGTFTGNIVTNGAGTLDIANAQTSTGISGLDALGTSMIVTPGITAGGGNGDSGLLPVIGVEGAATVKLTSNSGVVAGAGGAGIKTNGSGIGLAGGTLWIAPATLSGANKAVSVSGNTASAAYFYYGDVGVFDNSVFTQMSGNGTLLLDRGGNTSLAFTIGNSADTGAEVVRGGRSTLEIAATDGFSGLGSTEKFTILGTSTALPPVTNGMVSASIVGVSAPSDVLGAATFLTYSGTGTSSDTGFTGVTYDNTNFSATTSATTKEYVSGTQSISGSKSVYALRDDGTLTNTGTLTIGDGLATSSTVAGLILNNASILGTAGTLASAGDELAIYTEGTSTIANTISTANGLTVFGPGTLYLTQNSALSYGGVTTLDSGVLDVGSSALVYTNGNLQVVPNGSNLQVQGGVLEASGTFTRGLGSGNGSLQLINGGFAASLAAGLVVDIGGTSSSNLTTPLIWSYTGNFLDDASVLQLGSPTALGVVNLQNYVSLGFTTGGADATVNVFNGSNPDVGLYRNIGVTDNPSTYADYGQISGVISAGTGDFHGIEKSGNGLLYLSAANTYIGPTAISAGTLAINSDASLGTDPTAAYAIDGTVTLGALQIDGGATLLDWSSSTPVTLSAYRTVLLGGSATNAPSGVAVLTGQTLTIASRIGDSINGAGSLDINPTVGQGYDPSTTHGNVVLTSNYNTYSGGTTVESGTLYAENTSSSSSATGTGSVTVKSGAKLAGNGYIAPAANNTVTINSGATLSPGIASVTAAASGYLTLTATSGTVLQFNTPANGTPQLSFNLGTGTNGLTGSGLTSPGGVTLAGSSTYVDLPVDDTGEVVFSLTSPSYVSLNDVSGGHLAFGDYLLFTAPELADYQNLTENVNGVITGGLKLAPTNFTGSDLGALSTLYVENGDIYVAIVAPEPPSYAMLLLGLVAVLVLRPAQADPALAECLPAFAAQPR
jgi:fibronectin-binding autotransporter adhesin